MRRLDLAFAALELLVRVPGHAAQGAIMTLRNVKQDIDVLLDKKDDPSGMKSSAQVVARAAEVADPLDDRAPNVALN